MKAITNTAVRRLLIIVNPQSGKRQGLAVLEQVKPVFDAANVDLEVRVTKQPQDVRLIASTTDLNPFDGVCVIGGDGTIHEAVCGLFEQDLPVSVPLGIIPGGTGNDISRHLDVEGPLEFAQRIVAGNTSPFDVMRVEAGGEIHHCVVLVGWAGVADINCYAEQLRALGPMRYAASALRQIIFPRRKSAKIILDDQTIESDFLLVAACNTLFTGSGMQLAPRAKVDDGKVDVVIVRDASRWQMLRMFTKIFDGSHINLPCVEYYQTCALEIISDDNSPLDLDGEIKGSTPTKIETLPGALQIFV